MLFSTMWGKVRWFVWALLCGAAWVAVAQSSANSAIGSFLSLEGQVVAPAGSPTLGSTHDVQGRDVVQWTSLLQSRLDSPFIANGELNLPTGQTWVASSVKTPPNVVMGWKVGGNWVSSEPTGGTAVTAVRWSLAPLYTAKLEPVTGVVDFSGTGDGVRVIPYKDKLFVVNHYGSSGYFNCRSAKTGQACPGFESGGMAFEPSPGTRLRPAGNSLYYSGANPLEAVNYETGEMFVAMVQSGSRVVLCTNLDTLTSCGSWTVGSESGSYPSAFEKIGNEYYFGNTEGRLFCFDVAARRPCGQWAIGASMTNAASVDSLALGSLLFINNGRTLHCFDADSKRACAGWPDLGVGHSGSEGAFPVGGVNLSLFYGNKIHLSC